MSFWASSGTIVSSRTGRCPLIMMGNSSAWLGASSGKQARRCAVIIFPCFSSFVRLTYWVFVIALLIFAVTTWSSLLSQHQLDGFSCTVLAPAGLCVRCVVCTVCSTLCNCAFNLNGAYISWLYHCYPFFSPYGMDRKCVRKGLAQLQARPFRAVSRTYGISGRLFLSSWCISSQVSTQVSLFQYVFIN